MVGVRPHFAAGIAALSLLAPLASAQSREEARFYQAYYLENEVGDLEGARELYLDVAGDRDLARDLRDKARAFADALGEDIAASDFTRLVPRDAIFYAELSRPGEQISMLLEQLGLLGKVGETPERFGVSPLLIDGILGMRGAAVAVTEFDPEEGEPNGVLILHPGDLDVVRGLIETALPAAAQPVNPIGGHPTWSVEGEAFVTLTSRLVVASPDRDEIAGVVERLQGRGGASLAENEALQSVLEKRGEGLFSFCVNAEPILPMIEAMLMQEAQNDPEAMMMLSFLDVRSLRSISGHVGVDEDGINLELALELAEGHRNLAFNLLRLPHVEKETLELIPEGSAFFLAAGLNPEGDVAPLMHDAKGQPVVSFMDFGREIFGNLVDVTIYGMPPDASGASPIPDIAAILRVNDAERSRALWSFVLGTAGGASGGAMEGESVRIAGTNVDRYSVGGMPVYLAAEGNRLVISPSRAAIQGALEAKKRSSVLDDPVFADDAKKLAEGHTLIAMANPGRCIRLAQAFGEADDEMAVFAELLDETVVSVGLEHTDTRLALHARVSHIPDVSGLVAQAIRGEPRYGLGVPPRPKAPVEASVAKNAPEDEVSELRDSFAELAHAGDRSAAKAVGWEIFDAAFDDANALNDFAWTLLTVEPYEGNYLDLAMPVAERANELTDYQNWYYLDTLALCMFAYGEVEEAIRLEKKAVDLAAGDPRGKAARDALDRFEAALAQATGAGGG